MIRQSVINQLLQKKSSLFGLVSILILIILGVFAFSIIPDKSINTNRQIPSLALQPPGFTVKCLKVRKNVHIEEGSLLKQFLTGRKERYTYIPVTDWKIENNTLEAKLLNGSISYFSMANILYPVKSNEEIKINADGSFQFRNIDNDLISLNSAKAIQLINDKHIFNLRYVMGSDRYGRDIFSRLILGIRTSLMVGLIAIIISLVLGVSLGSIGGYYGGKIDQWIMLLINTSWSIPTLLLVFAIVLALGRGIGIIFIAVGLTMWVDVARIVRGEVKKLKEQNFVIAAKALGQSGTKIIIHHILPNILGPVLVITAANFAIAILLEAGLSFLGFGVKPPSPSLGNLLNENYGYAISGKPWLALIPSISIMMLVLSFNLVGSGLRDAFDVKTRN